MNLDVDKRFAIKARTISGCRRQLFDAILFAPVLLLAIAIGIGILILRFWMANWNPSPLNGCFSLAMFVTIPATAFVLWQRWRMRPAAFDTTLLFSFDALHIKSQSDFQSEQVIEWHWIQEAASRRMKGSIRTLRLVIDDPNKGRHAVEYALLDSRSRVTRFADTTVAWVERSKMRRHVK
jgi:hypothetical protein